MGLGRRYRRVGVEDGNGQKVKAGWGERAMPEASRKEGSDLGWGSVKKLTDGSG